MHFFTALASSLLALSGLALAAPAATDRVTTIEPPTLFKLQTKVVPGFEDCGTNKSNLWVYSFHTGAGQGDACLMSNKTRAMQAYLNDTAQLFTYPGNSLGGWPMAVTYIPYSFFSFVTISIASSSYTEGFYYNETGLQYNASFGGWIACDWWHGVPQLFNVASYEAAGPKTSMLPKSCSKVNLLPVAVEAEE